jgi:hypothetical protein
MRQNNSQEKQKIFHIVHVKAPGTGYVKARFYVPPITYTEAEQKFMDELQDGYEPVGIYKVLSLIFIALIAIIANEYIF